MYRHLYGPVMCWEFHRDQATVCTLEEHTVGLEVPGHDVSKGQASGARRQDLKCRHMYYPRGDMEKRAEQKGHHNVKAQGEMINVCP